MPDDERPAGPSRTTTVPSSPASASARRCSAWSRSPRSCLAGLIWSHHRSDVDELRYRARVLQAAADWTSVLINMNKDTVEPDLHTLHDGTVGQLNADFEATVEPYRKLVQKLQSQTTGQVDSVAIESIHHEQPGADGSAPPPQPELSPVRVAHRHRDGGRDVGQRERRRRKPQTVRWNAAARRLRRRRQAADLAAGADPMRNRLRVLAFDVARAAGRDRRAGLHRRRAGLAAVVGVGVLGAVPADRRGRRRQLRAVPPRRGHRRHRRRRSGAAAGRRRDGDRRAGGRAWWSATRSGRCPTARCATTPPRWSASPAASPRRRRRSRRRARPRRSTGRRRMMSPESAEAFRNEFAAVAKDLSEQEHLGSGQHGLGGRRGDRARTPPASR